jgi:hypothetical protein
MRIPAISLALAVAASAAAAQTSTVEPPAPARPEAPQSELSREIADAGLAATEARLAALTDASDADRFALAGVRFLSAVEYAFQLRWKYGLDDPTGTVPLMRTELDVNPAPETWTSGIVTEIFTGVDVRMASARAALEGINPTSDFGVDIRLQDVWFDVNANGTRDSNEAMTELLGPIMLGWRWFDRDPVQPWPGVRFDAADAAWLSAYTHMLQGISNVILAYDPAQALDEMLASRATFLELSPPRPPSPDSFDNDFSASFGQFADVAIIFVRALDQDPDAERMQAAHEHFLSMIEDNRAFWTRVNSETDDDREWLPNARQASALGLVLPPETGEVWKSVLSESEAVLKGELLIPYWRIREGAGVDLSRVFLEPKAIDLAGWIQGVDALPYIRKGPVMTGDSWGRFGNLMGGEAMLMSIYLN